MTTRYISRRYQTVGTGKGRKVVPGDEVPEAASWRNLDMLIEAGYVERVADPDELDAPPEPETEAEDASLQDGDASPLEGADESEDAPEACPTCGAVGDDPCRTNSGNTRADPHAARG